MLFHFSIYAVGGINPHPNPPPSRGRALRSDTILDLLQLGAEDRFDLRIQVRAVVAGSWPEVKARSSSSAMTALILLKIGIVTVRMR